MTKIATAALTTFLNSARQALQFDLWTFTLGSGTQLRWTDADTDLTTLDARTFVRGPVLTRDRVNWKRGIEVGQCKVTMAGPSVLLDGRALPAFAAAGGFDGCTASLERAYLNDAAVMQGSLVWFAGAVADVTPSRMGCELLLKDPLTQLSQHLPRNLYQAGCLNDLYDSNCAVNRASFTVAGTVSAVGTGSNPTVTVSMASSVPARRCELGAVKFASGQNAGLSRTVQGQPASGTSITFAFSRPFPFAIAVGDTITAAAGCDKAQATCSGTFGNLARFRGQPYIPVPETVT
jgi:uncharacterized phage protein (TIGR02218 family)